MKKNLILFFCSVLIFAFTSNAQLVTIVGKVLDEKGQPVARASIIEKGTKNGVSTSATGIFTLKVKEKSQIFISAIGYTDVVLEASSYMEVALKQNIESLDEVVITATQAKRNKKSIVYANQTIKSDELNSVTNRSALNALQGKVAGVKISQSSGAVGASTRLVLRGETSLTGNNNALIVVDGVPINNSLASAGGGTGTSGDRDNYVDFGNRGNDINPDDIESITILKGPAATTLFGSRGASGVVLLTTKKGKAGASNKPKVSFNSSASTERVYLVMKQQEQFGSGYSSCGHCGGSPDIFMGENFSWGPKLDGRLIPWTAIPVDNNGNFLPLSNGKTDQLVRPYSYVKNHLKSFFDYGYSFRNNLSISGGDEKFTYFLSYTNFSNNGIVPNTNFKKNNFLLNATAALSSKLTSTFSFNYTKLNQRGATEGGYPFGYSSGTPAYSFALQTPVNIPFGEMRDYNNPYQDFKGFYAQYSINPYFILDKQELKNDVDNFLASVSLNYSLTKNLSITGKVSTNVIGSNTYQKNPVFSYARAYSWTDGQLGENGGGARSSFSLGDYRESSNKINNLTFDLITNYTKDLTPKLKLNVTAGYNSFEEKTANVSGQTNGGLVIPEFYNLNNSKSTATSTNNSTLYRIFGVYGNAYLGYDNTYFLEYSARNDWSSSLPSTSRKYFYQSIGASAVLTNNLKIDKKYISYLKLRASIGTTGKDAQIYLLENYFISNPTVLDYGNNYQIKLPYNGNLPGAIKGSLIGNPNLKPELTITSEGGFDLGLFNDKLNIEYTYYNSKSKNQIVTVNLPWSSGYNSIPLNIGRMDNIGHELAIRATVLKVKGFEWKIYGSYSTNKNKVVSIAPEYGLSELPIYSGLVHFSGHGSMNLIAKEGLPFGTFKGTDFVYDAQGHIVVDQNGNPKQSSDLKYLGSVQPKYLTSFGSDLIYKGLQFHFLFDAKKGGYFYSGSKLSTEFNGTASTTTLHNRENFVLENSVVETSPGSGVYKTNTTTTNAYQYLGKTLPASGYLIDASYIKLREVSLFYALPSNFIKHTPFATLGFGLFAKNLKYWLPKENTFADPEVGGVGANSNAQGIETSTTPSSRSFGVELKLTLK